MPIPFRRTDAFKAPSEQNNKKAQLRRGDVATAVGLRSKPDPVGSRQYRRIGSGICENSVVVPQAPEFSRIQQPAE
jgi:hypothetical protein